MKFVVFVEGETEQKALPGFLKRWLEARLNQAVGIEPRLFIGGPELIREAPLTAGKFLNDPKQRDNIIAVISLLDLYELRLSYPGSVVTIQERYEWAKQELESRVNQPQFRQFFAVHETEAWLLSEPHIFPREIQQALSGKSRQPELLNFDEPPARLLNKLYEREFKHRYKKAVDGPNLFRKLDPDIAYNKCPYLKLMLDEMLRLAQAAGL